VSLLTIKRNDEVVYQGNILDMPIKSDWIIKKSIELFDDDDPCIIHKSFVIKKYVDEFLKLTDLKNQSQVKLGDYAEKLTFIALDLTDTIATYEE